MTQDNSDLAKKIKEFNALAAKQCEEYRQGLEWAILAWYQDNPLVVKDVEKLLYMGAPVDIERLLKESRSVKFVLGKVEAGFVQNDKTTVSVVYEYQDYLHDFLSCTLLPDTLCIAKMRATTLPEEMDGSAVEKGKRS